MSNETAADRSVAELIKLHFAEFTAAEKRTARALVADYPAAGLGTVTQLAERAAVSSATIVRFAQSLGFDGFREFQDRLRHELGTREDSALSQALRRESASGSVKVGTLAASQRAFTEGIEYTFDSLRDDEVRQLVSWLADPKLRITARGGLYSGLLAQHLVKELLLFRPNVLECPRDPVELATQLVDTGAKTDVWVVFDFRRYTTETERIVRRAKSHGARVALITDRWLSPIAAIADVVMSCRVEANGPSDSLVPGLALVEGLCELAVEQLGDAGIARLRQIDPLRTELESGIREDS
ncbi:MurR/RpiR family transcriptional regulator [Gulosibacter sediminis]|uniref:MurR/RpiR family transcriptional regulator n=1 Tax=Gulosibacter sediminis TaxID=1729695 RepID=UPI0024ACCA15|nr:MurR/RpiR family transcriptional regulator [Gulosibacter sediminis]